MTLGDSSKARRLHAAPRRGFFRRKPVRKAAAGLLALGIPALIGMSLAHADSPDPKLPFTGVAVVNNDGSTTLTLSGGWAWTTHKNKDCNTDRFGVGWQVDWNDDLQPGNEVGTVDGTTVDVGAETGNGFNPADNTVNFLTNGNGHRCGEFDAGLKYNVGEWGPSSHTYPPTQTTFNVCVVTYDIHQGNPKTTPKDGDLVAGGDGHNHDNSVQDNKNTPLGNQCFLFQVPSISTSATASVVAGNAIHDVATLSNGAAPTGTITFNLFGPDDADCSGPVAYTHDTTVNGNNDYDSGNFVPTDPGTYRWVASYSGDSQNAATTGACGDDGETTEVTPVPRLSISLEKDGPALAHIGDTVHYTFAATNDGQTPLTEVTLTDPKCNATPTLGTKTGGNQDDTLDPGETWNFSCDHVVTADDADPLPNTATVSTEEGATDQASHEVDIIHPAIAIVKTADPTSGDPGDSVTFSYAVTNTGDVPLTNVSVDDDKLGHIDTIANLAVDETVTVTKTVDIGDTSVTNVGTATGTDPLGSTVSAHDDATVEVVAPAAQEQVQPEELARTGAAVDLYVEWALALLLIGMMFFGAGSLVGRRNVAYVATPAPVMTERRDDSKPRHAAPESMTRRLALGAAVAGGLLLSRWQRRH